MAAVTIKDAYKSYGSVKVLHGIFLCKPSPRVRAASISRASWSAALPMVLLAGLCVLFGVGAQGQQSRRRASPLRRSLRGSVYET